MANTNSKCPKCDGEMVQGFVQDYNYSYSAAFVGKWLEGKPKKSFWNKLKAPYHQGIPIGAFRCQKCGFLELYSDPKFAAA